MLLSVFIIVDLSRSIPHKTKFRCWSIWWHYATIFCLWREQPV